MYVCAPRITRQVQSWDQRGDVGTTCGPQFTTCFKTPRNLSPGGSHPKCEAPPMDPGYQNQRFPSYLSLFPHGFEGAAPCSLPTSSSGRGSSQLLFLLTALCWSSSLLSCVACSQQTHTELFFFTAEDARACLRLRN